MVTVISLHKCWLACLSQSVYCSVTLISFLFLVTQYILWTFYENKDSTKTINQYVQ